MSKQTKTSAPENERITTTDQSAFSARPVVQNEMQPDTDADDVEDDDTPVLDEQDLEENDLTAEEAEDIEWEEEEEDDDDDDEVEEDRP